MLIDGKQIAAEIGAAVREALVGRPAPTLLVIQVGNNAASTSFIKMKQQFAESVGITLRSQALPDTAQTEDLLKIITEANGDKQVQGMIVQLPLPTHIDTRLLLDAINPRKDPDLLSSENRSRFADGSSLILPPVVAAVAEIIERFGIDLALSNIAVLGYGTLVGEPVGVWLRAQHLDYAVLTEENENPERILVDADVIISGVGKPGIIKPHMIKEGCTLIDAGTSESPSVSGETGKLAGDADPECAERAALMTPVPGGVGPVAVAMLMVNLARLLETGE